MSQGSQVRMCSRQLCLKLAVSPYPYSPPHLLTEHIPVSCPNPSPHSPYLAKLHSGHLYFLCQPALPTENTHLLMLCPLDPTQLLKPGSSFCYTMFPLGALPRGFVGLAVRHNRAPGIESSLSHFLAVWC